MRKFVLFLAVLVMAVPAMAAPTVTINCVPDGNNVTVSYAVTGSTHLVRAFGLDITTTGGDIVKVVPVDANYRIFPGEIVITNGEVTDYGTCYDPCDLGDANVTIEVGSLYTTDANYEDDPNFGYGMQPSLSGTLLKFYVDDRCSYTVTENALRGGVVMEDPNESRTVNLCSGSVVVPMDYGDAPDDPCNLLDYPTLFASNGARHIPDGVMLGRNRDTELDGQPSANCLLDDTTGVPDDEDGVTILAATMKSVFARVIVKNGPGKLNAWVDWNNDSDWADPCEQIFTDRDVVDGNNTLISPRVAAAPVRETQLVSRWRVNRDGGLSYTGPASDGEVEDYKGLVVTNCYPGAPGEPNWVEAGSPICWCYPRQCRGDADGKKYGTALTGYWYVGQPDLSIMAMGWLKKDPPKGSGILQLWLDGVPAACADFARDKTGTPLTGYWRIGQPDLTKMSVYWLKKEPPKGSGTPADCLPGNRNP